MIKSTWPLRKLGDIATIHTGATPPTSNAEFFGGDIPFVTPGDLTDFSTISTWRTTLTEEGAARARLLPAHSILVCCIGATIGKVGYAPRSVASNQQINALVFDKSAVYPRFGFYACTLLKPTMLGMSGSTTLPIVSKSKFQQLCIPVPPLPEQRRIAAILDKADAIQQKRIEGIRLTEDLLRSVFLEMFGESSELSHRWKTVPFEQIVDSTKLGLVRGSPQITESGEYPYLRMDGILGDGHLQLNPIKRTDATSTESREFRLQKNDFLFNTRNSSELVGKTALFESDEVVLFNNNIMRVRFTNKVRPQYMIGLFQTPFIQKQLDSRKSGTTSVFAIYAKNLNTVEIPLPPVALQERFCDLRNRLQSIREARQTGYREANSLFHSLVQRTFRGEL